MGNHGAEYISDGEYRVVDGAGEARGHIDAVLEHVILVAEDEGLFWEDKGFSVTVHIRKARDLEGLPIVARVAIPDVGVISRYARSGCVRGGALTLSEYGYANSYRKIFHREVHDV